MFDQRNQQFSTILLATTIMLSALVCCLAQGVLPAASNLDQFIYNLYSVATSLSVAFLFLCLVFCVEVMWRSSKFMYKRSKYNNGYLAKAIKKTKQMMGAIRGANLRANKQRAAELKQPEQSASNAGCESETSARNIRSRNIVKMTGTDIDKEFISYEHEINYYHTNREAMIDKSAYMVTADDGTMVESKSFEKFWRDSCSFYGNAAILSFYSGSAALFFANVTFMWTVNLYMYKSIRSAKVCVTVILISLISSIMLLIYMRYVEKISMDNNVTEEGDKHSWGSFRTKMASLSSSRSDGSFSLGLRGLSSLLSSSKRPSERNSSMGDEENRKSPRCDDNGETVISDGGGGSGDGGSGKGRGRGRGRVQSVSTAQLPIARSLELSPNFLGIRGEAKIDSPPLPTADAEFPAVLFPAGVFDRG